MPSPPLLPLVLLASLLAARACAFDVQQFLATLPANTTEINLAYQGITALPADAFQRFADLRNL
jgi:hypothetical protein